MWVIMLILHIRALVLHLGAACFCAVFGSSLLPALAQARELVTMSQPYEPGAIVVSTSQRILYFVNGDRTAIRYRVAVGSRAGNGSAHARLMANVFLQPAWSPPAEVRRDKPSLPDVIAGGAPNNPMGAAALTIYPGQYAVRRTSASMRRSIGTFASYGCIRMLDEDVLDLYARVRVGARIHVMP